MKLSSLFPAVFFAGTDALSQTFIAFSQFCDLAIVFQFHSKLIIAYNKNLI